MWCFDQFAICQKTDGQGLLFIIVRQRIMMPKSGKNTMIQGLSTNTDSSLPRYWSSSSGFFRFCSSEGWSMAESEEELLLYNKDDRENLLLVDLDASFSDSVSSTDCTLTLIVLFFNRTECSLLLCFPFGNLDTSCHSFEGVWEKWLLLDLDPSLSYTESSSSESASKGIVNFFMFLWCVLR